MHLKSNIIYNKALELMPGGVSSPVRALKSVGGNPLFIERANGAFLWDVDNNRYIDLCMSFGPLILGHANPNVISAISLALGNGTSFGTSTPGEVNLAEKIVKAHPSVNWVRFVNSGTEAVMSSIRLARGYTNRDLIIKFDGGYHGHADSMLVKAGSGLATLGLSSSEGVPQDTAKNTIVLALNDITAVKSAFEKYDNQIACVIIEGVPANNGLLIQTKEFMHEIQNLCKKNGALFILDEVITGFRIGLGGAAEYYDLKPDIVTLGKVIGGGLPIGAYGGRKDLLELMAPIGPVYQAGTLSGNPIAMAAGNATMDILMTNSIYQDLEDISESFESQTSSLFAENNIPLTIRRIGSIIWLILDSNSSPMSVEEISKSSVNEYTNFHKFARLEGVYMPPSAYEVAFLSTAHNLSVIDDLMDRLERVVKQL
ncbi:MAG: Glutamate-1-semialdehyde 2,1-aminomutase [Candidatus Heimdallarchaeota archaeon LC_2]|nr:MAG: Glutamate-1-semialdehyde 2,1-aminomutase [Candidatus Heimdallarchaeota archaeon LC_2]